jgi:hypothetical protein
MKQNAPGAPFGEACIGWHGAGRLRGAFENSLKRTLKFENDSPPSFDKLAGSALPPALFGLLLARRVPGRAFFVVAGRLR